MAVYHGYMSAREKGYGKRRGREIDRVNREFYGPRTNTGKANVSGWQQLEHLFGQMGAPVQHGGDRFVQ